MLLNAVGVVEVETAGDGDEALRQLTKSGAPAVSLALIDLMMPLMDGLACLRRLRAWEREGSGDRRRTRCIAVTANADDPGCVDEALAAGFDDVLAKPLTAAKLRELLMDAWSPPPAEQIQRPILGTR